MSQIVASSVPRRAMDFVWVSSHYDCHLSGLCRHNGKLCRFSIENEEEDTEAIYTIFSLSPIERLRWIYRKKKFEICVGDHWTYRGGKRDKGFVRRNPKWLAMILWAWQYGSLRSAYHFFYSKTRK